MPGTFVDQGAQWVASGKTMKLVMGTEDEQLTIAWISWNQRASEPSEYREKRSTLGKVDDEGRTRTVVLHVPYVNERGKMLSASSTRTKGTLATRHYLDLGIRELKSWIAIDEVESGASAPVVEEEVVSKRSHAFWGVWDYASHDLAKVAEKAEKARHLGFSAEVLVTSDWANLDDESWYVVSLGCYDTQVEARSLLEHAKVAGFADAYVLWSGAYQH